MPSTHAQIDARSLEMRQLIADRIATDPSLLTKAIENLDRWEAQRGWTNPYFVKWRALLGGNIQDLLAMMRAPGEEATAMRQAAPFAGPDFITQEERLALFGHLLRLIGYTVLVEADNLPIGGAPLMAP